MIQTNKHRENKIFMKLEKYIPLTILFLSSIIVIMVVSKNSPLFYINDWVDLNAFLTMGKGWNHGLIPYRDLFEQKGPILYLLFALASKISSSYFGVYILEVINLTIVSYLYFKIGNMFFDKRKSYVFVFATYILLFVTPYFKFGGSAEEFGWLSVVYGIYLIFLIQKNDFQVSKIYYFFAGIMLSYLFWIKYTMIGVWIGFFLSLLIIFILKKEYKQIAMIAVYSLLGFFSITVPILIYFKMNNALDSLYFAYFYSNIKLYPNNLGLSLISKIFNSLFIFAKHMSTSPYFFVLYILGFLLVIYSRKIIKNNYILFLYASSYVVLILTVLFGGKDWNYYYLIIFPFGAIPLMLLIDKIKKITIFQIILGFIVCIITMVGMNQNIRDSKLFPTNPSLSTEGQDFEPAQKIFASIIKKEKNPTLLNYGTLDVGLYHAADILPGNYYFMRQNISDELLPDIMDEQNKIVDEKKVDFIVTASRRELGDKTIPDNIKKNYKLVAEHSQDFEGDRTYRLYKKK